MTHAVSDGTDSPVDFEPEARSARSERLWTLLAVACVVVAAFVGVRQVHRATREGPGLTPDSRDYVQMARSLVAGTGVSHYNGDLTTAPETHFAPLFSVVLAGLLRVGVPFERAARWLNIVLFSINSGLSALVIARCVPRRHALAGAIVGSVVCSLSPVLVHVYCMAWSEPLFFTFMLLTFLLVGQSLETGDRRWLLAGAAAASMTMLARYAAMSLVLSTAAAVLTAGSYRRALARRLTDAVLFGVIASIPLGIWLIRNRLLTGGSTDRQFAFHPLLRADLQAAMITLADWILPTSERPFMTSEWPRIEMIGAVAATVGMLASLIYVGYCQRRTPVETRSGTTPLLLWFAPTYAAFIAVSSTWLDAATEMDFRILCPVYLAVLMLAVTAVFSLVSAMRGTWRRPTRWVVIALAVSLGVYECHRPMVWSEAMRRHGLGYYSRIWRNSQLLPFAKQLPPDSVIYTNATDAVYLLLNRLSKPLPKTFLPGSLIDVGSKKSIAGMRRDLQNHDGYLLIFRTVSREYMVPEDRLQSHLRLETAFEANDGVAYRVPLTKTQNPAAPATAP